jgi:hypothetical protein
MFNIGGCNGLGLGNSSWSWIINLIIVIVALEFLVNILSCNGYGNCD